MLCYFFTSHYIYQTFLSKDMDMDAAMREDIPGRGEFSTSSQVASVAQLRRAMSHVWIG